ncbi:glycoside hydrolase family 5 protein [Asticcacaulis machinosus]|uniref:Glycoside hydrolase family 5 protein n=1 Tax=Asticcacaulis machinosus TaxID=2984211 RepID=A0ABT5HKG5_9CAUL|nr:glycoside hydrolase family 5 protein [Asticcacaulis machinosus]MDC7676478.1 glycoside hydrolase family 5 protein [Asticcacaulis machinosus]
MKTTLKSFVTAFVMAAVLAVPAHADMSVRDGQVVESSGAPFVMRGINHAHLWAPNRTNQALKDIAATGANTVRIVLGNGVRWNRTSERSVRRLITQSKAAGLICVLEVHDTTGYGQTGEGAPKDAATIAQATDYWIGIKDALIGQEDYVILNIANEPSGNGVADSYWVDEHKAAIVRLRAAGLKNVIMVDGPNWGQDASKTMLQRAGEVFESDPLKNTMFSVHMYQVYDRPEVVRAYLDGFRSQGLALIVGEFGPDHEGEPVDEATIFDVTNAHGIGYLGWSWSGNGPKARNLDMVVKFNARHLTPWGDRLINGEGGIRATSKPAAIFRNAPEPKRGLFSRWFRVD